MSAGSSNTPNRAEFLVRELYEEVKKQGFPEEICISAAELLSSIVDILPGEREPNNVLLTFKKLMGQIHEEVKKSELFKLVVKGTIAKIASDLFMELFKHI